MRPLLTRISLNILLGQHGHEAVRSFRGYKNKIGKALLQVLLAQNVLLKFR
jgi:hypothetical protein